MPIVSHERRVRFAVRKFTQRDSAFRIKNSDRGNGGRFFFDDEDPIFRRPSALYRRRMSRDYVFMGIHQSLSLSRLRISAFSLRIKVVSISRRSPLAVRAASPPFFFLFPSGQSLGIFMREINGPNSARCPRFRAAQWAPLDTSLILFSENMSVVGVTVQMQP